MSEKIFWFQREELYGCPMDRLETLLKRPDRAWCEFLESYAGLLDPDLLVQSVAGSWSVKDIVAHVMTWEEEALKYLSLVLQRKRLLR
jgi:hypothetical protein